MLIAVTVLFVASVILSTTGIAIRIGETKNFCYFIGSPFSQVNQETWVRELYGMCALKDPEGNVVLKVGPTNQSYIGRAGCLYSSGDRIDDGWSDSTRYMCSFTKKFDKSGIWKVGVAIGYVNKTWDGSKWIIEEGIAVSQTYEIEVSKIPMPPETGPEILQSLWNKFINLF